MQGRSEGAMIFDKLMELIGIDIQTSPLPNCFFSLHAEQLRTILYILNNVFGKGPQTRGKKMSKAEMVQKLTEIYRQRDELVAEFSAPNRLSADQAQLYKQLMRSFRPSPTPPVHKKAAENHYIDYQKMMQRFVDYDYRYRLLQKVALFNISDAYFFQLQVTIIPQNNICYVCVFFQEQLDDKGNPRLAPLEFANNNYNIFYLNGTGQWLTYDGRFEFVRLEHIDGANNYLDFQPLNIVKNAQMLCCYCAVYLAEEHPAEALFQELLKRPQLASRFFQDVLRHHGVSCEAFPQDESAAEEVEVQTQQFSLISQLTLAPIRLPVRGVGCTHVGSCMDLKEYESEDNERCYICKRQVAFEDLRVDAVGYYMISSGVGDLIEADSAGRIVSLHPFQHAAASSAAVDAEESSGWADEDA